jgi:hypothetical protein
MDEKPSFLKAPAKPAIIQQPLPPKIEDLQIKECLDRYEQIRLKNEAKQT